MHPDLNDVLIIKSNHPYQEVRPEYPSVIVGVQCGVAILRGAQAYAPGVIAMPNGLAIGSKVSVFADLKGQCKRGFTGKYLGPTYFVGNGILVQDRKDLFTIDVPKGIAINMVEPLFDCPSIGDILLDVKTGLHKGFLQNLPSILCGHVLEPNEQCTVLDMCAAPGGKTTHLATLMNGKGVVLAIDKSTSKVLQIQANALRLGLRNIKTFVFNSVNAVKVNKDDRTAGDGSDDGPPFLKESFDRILLDAPCSALGQRPQLYSPIRLKELESFPRLQRKLFVSAAELLKVGGRLVYSTCTYNVAENEGIVSWALRRFPYLELVPTWNFTKLGQPGYQIDGLTPDDCYAMRRFGPSRPNDENCDSIGFFLCCFQKKYST